MSEESPCRFPLLFWSALLEIRIIDARSELRAQRISFCLVLGKTASRGFWTRTSGHDWVVGVVLVRLSSINGLQR